MSLKTRVKTANITNLSDARYCAGMGVEFLGFPLQETTAIADLKRYTDIRTWISGPFMVLEMSSVFTIPGGPENLSADNVDFIQIHVDDLVNFASLPPLPLIVSVDLAAWETSSPALYSHKSRISYLVIYSADTLLSRRELIRKIAKEFSVFLTIKDADNDLAGILDLGVEGIELSGSHEDKPGLKGYDHLSAILEQLED